MCIYIFVYIIKDIINYIIIYTIKDIIFIKHKLFKICMPSQKYIKLFILLYINDIIKCIYKIKYIHAFISKVEVDFRLPKLRDKI